MTSDQLTAFVTQNFPEVKPGTNKQYPEFLITADKIHDLAKTLKLNPEARMDYLFCETAADRKDGLHVVYFVNSTTHGHSAILRVILPDKANAVVPTVSDVWRAAEFHEREVFDLFGIRFENHPNMKRIFLDDDWVGYPLRKDYKDTFTIER
jgi:NADH-quinone oxidoreductase subunit C